MSAVYPVSAPRLHAGVTAADLQVERGDFSGALDALLRVSQPEPAAAAEPDRDRALRFSRHASERLERGGLRLGEGERRALGEALDKLEARGGRESLVLLDDYAFIVGVQRRTVISAMTRREALGQVFTQIDSTLVVR